MPMPDQAQQIMKASVDQPFFHEKGDDE